ncbi:MAG TPA: hypothetical protein VFB60_15555 [Ktedonobacteraceae bacterium]|nr:hypothetical protein [Ktedonobacteraceae bacterium]
MFKLSHLKWFVVVIALMIMSMATVSTAFASSAVGNQNPDLTVAASLTSNGANPNQAAVGNTVTVSYSVKNDTKANLTFKETFTLTVPKEPAVSFSVNVTLAAGRADAHTFSFTDVSFLPKGTYSLEVAATDSKGTSSATATITLV